MSSRVDLKIGSKYNSWTVLNNLYKIRGKAGQVEVQCDCGTICITSKYAVKAGNIKQCFTCSQTKKSLNRRLGVGEMSGYYWGQLVANAKVRNLDVDISKEYIYELFNIQNKKCALSGIELTLDNYIRGSGTASVDRKDSSKGYIEGNLQWVHKDINIMKSNHTDEDFINICILVANHNK